MTARKETISFQFDQQNVCNIFMVNSGNILNVDLIFLMDLNIFCFDMKHAHLEDRPIYSSYSFNVNLPNK